MQSSFQEGRKSRSFFWSNARKTVSIVSIKIFRGSLIKYDKTENKVSQICIAHSSRGIEAKRDLKTCLWPKPIILQEWKLETRNEVAHRRLILLRFLPFITNLK